MTSDKSATRSKGGMIRRLGGIALLVGLAVGGVARAQPDGHALFTQNCSACHQPEGQGIPGAFPALAGDKFVQGPGEAVASVVLNGRGGMPAFAGDLSNETIAAILTYVRSSWGNTAPALTPTAVAGVRASSGVEHAGSALQAH